MTKKEKEELHDKVRELTNFLGDCMSVGDLNPLIPLIPITPIEGKRTLSSLVAEVDTLLNKMK